MIFTGCENWTRAGNENCCMNAMQMFVLEVAQFHNFMQQTLLKLQAQFDISKNYNCFQKASETSRCLKTCSVVAVLGLSWLMPAKHLPAPAFPTLKKHTDS